LQDWFTNTPHRTLLAIFIFPLDPFLNQVYLHLKKRVFLLGVVADTATGLPERFIVYHAGTVRTVFVGVMKITTIMLFSCSCLVLAPALHMSSESPPWAGMAGETGRGKSTL
jgi:hypothetical protein